VAVTEDSWVELDVLTVDAPAALPKSPSIITPAIIVVNDRLNDRASDAAEGFAELIPAVGAMGRPLESHV